MRGALADVRLGANGLKTSHKGPKGSSQKQSFASGRYLFDSSRANYQIPAVGLCACSTEPRSTALPDWCRQGTLIDEADHAADWRGLCTARCAKGGRTRPRTPKWSRFGSNDGLTRR